MQKMSIVLLAVVFFAANLKASDITGQVRVGNQRGLSEPATVQLIHDLQVVSDQFTDLNGRFEFLSVTPGSYIVRATYLDMKSSDVPVEADHSNAHYQVAVNIDLARQPPAGKTETVNVATLQLTRAARREYDSGLKERRRNNCSAAIGHLEKAIQLFSHYGEAYNELGICQKALGRLSESEDSFHKAIEYNATIYPSINLADLYVSEQRFDAASQVIRAAKTGNPTEGDLDYAMARIHFEQGHLEEAERAALEAHARIHRTADVHLLLAKIYLRRENYPALLTQLETYLDENPDGTNSSQIRETIKALKARTGGALSRPLF